jgi:hypothetical protein
MERLCGCYSNTLVTRSVCPICLVFLPTKTKGIFVKGERRELRHLSDCCLQKLQRHLLKSVMKTIEPQVSTNFKEIKLTASIRSLRK